jgi:hypothetical protein
MNPTSPLESTTVAKNELDFEPKNAQIAPKKRVLGGAFHATRGFSVEVARAGVRLQVSGVRCQILGTQRGFRSPYSGHRMKEPKSEVRR